MGMLYLLCTIGTIGKLLIKSLACVHVCSRYVILVLSFKSTISAADFGASSILPSSFLLCGAASSLPTEEENRIKTGAELGEWREEEEGRWLLLKGLINSLSLSCLQSL